jgi:hypothetical protein
MIEIKPVEYDEYECLGEKQAICPYCGCKNNVDYEDYGNQDENQLDYCGRCSKYFIRQTNYRITFTTQPVENFYIEEKEMLLKRINKLENEVAKDDMDKQYKEFYLQNTKYDLKQLEENYGKACLDNQE